MENATLGFTFRNVQLLGAKAVQSFYGQAVLILETIENDPFLAILLLLALSVVAWINITRATFGHEKKFPPAVPGIPIIGNLLQLAEKKPHRTFAALADKFGPIFTVRIGSDTMVIVNSSIIAKEAMVTKYSSICTRKMAKALSTLTNQKAMASMSDYGPEHRLLKKMIVNHLLGQIPQKANRNLRQDAIYKMIDQMFDELRHYPGSIGLVDMRRHIEESLFPFLLHQVIGRNPDGVFIKEMGRSVSRRELYEILVMDPLRTVIDVDWRDLFPAFKWVPNRNFEENLSSVERKRTIAMRALIEEQKGLLANGKQSNCYLDILLTEYSKDLTQTQLEMSAWEAIVGGADTTSVIIEWAMYEISKHPEVQEELYEELKEVAGDGIVTEDHLPRLPLLDAVVKETLRKYPSVPLILPRHVDEDVKLAGYDILKGWQIIINVYGINRDKNVWARPEIWDPKRFLGDNNIDSGFKDGKVLSFGLGKRMCAGVMQAMLVITMNIALNIQHFKWSLHPDEEKLDAANTAIFTNSKLHPLKAIAEPRVPKRLNA